MWKIRKVGNVRAPLLYRYTCHVLREEALLLNGRVALEDHEHLIARRENRMRLFVAAETSQARTIR